MFKHDLATVRRDLVSRLYQVAYALEEARAGLGGAFLGLDGRPPLEWPHVDEFDLSTWGFADALPSLHRYASLGEDDGRASNDSMIEADCDAGRARMILQMSRGSVVESTARWMEGELGMTFDSNALSEMLDVIEARRALDSGTDLSVQQVAVLAGLDQRTARNALHAQGDARLHATRLADGSVKVEHREALRWLLRRPGFAPTSWAGDALHVLPAPDRVAPDDLPVFLRQRLYKLHSDQPELTEWLNHLAGRATEAPPVVSGSAVVNLGSRLQWIPGRLEQVLTGTGEALQPIEIAQLARALHLGRLWLERQLSNDPEPSATPQAPPLQHVFDEATGSVTVTLSAAGIANGYLNIPTRHAERVFPADAFGGRAGNQRGIPVTLVVDGEAMDSDIRRQSRALTSPRKRFNGWFRRCQATPGDQVRIEPDGERRFVLRFLPASNRT